MNYIRQLTEVFQYFIKDQKLNPTHVSLYFALFYYWNGNRFPEIFFVQREEIMQLSKIGSTSTYHKCLKDLHDWNYLEYLPSRNPFKGSQVKMIEFRTSSEQDEIEQEKSGEIEEENSRTRSEYELKKLHPSTETALVSYINNIKHNKHNKTKNKKDIVEYFKKNNWSVKEALKFFSHYEATGWKMGGNVEIEDWQALAEGWIIISREKNELKKVKRKDNLQISKFKNYGEPL